MGFNSGFKGLRNLHVCSCIHNPPPLIPTVSEVKPMYKLRSHPLSHYWGEHLGLKRWK